MWKTRGKRSNQEELYRVFVLGASGVGRSEIINQFLHGYEMDNYSPVLTDDYPKDCVIDSVPTTLRVYDSVDMQEELLGLLRLCMEIGEGFLLVFSLNDYSSFLKIQKYHEMIRKMRNRKFPMVMVGNEADLYRQREVSVEEAQNLAITLGITYIECSVGLRLNVEQVFYEIARIIRKYQSRRRSKIRNSVARYF